MAPTTAPRLRALAARADPDNFSHLLQDPVVASAASTLDKETRSIAPTDTTPSRMASQAGGWGTYAPQWVGGRWNRLKSSVADTWDTLATDTGARTAYDRVQSWGDWAKTVAKTTYNKVSSAVTAAPKAYFDAVEWARDRWQRGPQKGDTFTSSTTYPSGRDSGTLSRTIGRGSDVSFLSDAASRKAQTLLSHLRRAVARKPNNGARSLFSSDVITRSSREVSRNDRPPPFPSGQRKVSAKTIPDIVPSEQANSLLPQIGSSDTGSSLLDNDSIFFDSHCRHSTSASQSPALARRLAEARRTYTGGEDDITLPAALPSDGTKDRSLYGSTRPYTASDSLTPYESGSRRMSRHGDLPQLQQASHLQPS